MSSQIDQEISLLKRVEIQSEVLVPVIEALRAEIGRERANEIVFAALREWMGKEYREISAHKAGAGKEKWRQVSAELETIIGQDVEWRVSRDDSQAMEFDVTGCRYAELFKKLGEPELGAILTCEIDDHVVEAAGSGVELNRPRTIMTGSTRCEFRYRFSETEQH